MQMPLGGLAPAPAEKASPRAPSAGRRVLVIEDNPDAAESLRVLLRLSGHEVRIALSGPAGLEAYRVFRPEVVICDLGLPGGMDGHAIARAIRREPQGASVRLIAATGYGRPEDQRRSREAGFDYHLTKPIDLAHLMALVVAPCAEEKADPAESVERAG